MGGQPGAARPADAKIALGVTVAVSLVLAGYLAAQVAAPAASHPPPAPDPRAPWVTAGEPVPPAALYTESDPAPAFQAKERSWHNRLLFPTIRCPYCGRRVPTEHGSYVFLLIGMLGQAGFASRFLVQWIASERAGRSIMPLAFWWLSIAGSLLLLLYAMHIKAVPIVLGQLPNCFIYARNLHLVKRYRERQTPMR